MMILLLANIIPMLVSIGFYVLTALSLYTLGKRRGIRKPWLSWIPVGDAWILGSLSDQYRYVNRHQETNRRKILVTLYLVLLALLVLFLGSIAWAAIREDGGMAPAAAMLMLSITMMGVSVFALVLRYMALFDVFKSTAQENAVLYLVLSILFPVTEPFFLFFNRNSDRGMEPEQRELPGDSQVKVYGRPQSETRDPWDQN